MEEYLTASDAAVAMGISYPTLIARIRRGKLPAIKHGHALFIRKDVVADIKSKQGDGHGVVSGKEVTTTT